MWSGCTIKKKEKKKDCEDEVELNVVWLYNPKEETTVKMR